MGCSCKKTLPAKILIGISLIIIVLFNHTTYASLAFSIGGVLQAIGLIWFFSLLILQHISNKQHCVNKNKSKS
ncbi:hypothetical protein [Vagococcus jeotgali]|uniref:hypothetical protein n=1 Tax=Vagococcus jeotgali TaxID=3109030 RepID=UPI002DDB28D9|nr:hypothetical protein [Vagococcus sp. B2T-5]